MAKSSKNLRASLLWSGLATAMTVTSSHAQSLDLGTLVLRGDPLSNVSAEDIQRFPGSRQVINLKDEAEGRGDASVSDAIKRVPGAISSQNSGTGGSPFGLNIGVRGQTQRLTPRSTVLLDGIPIANAPYTQPQLSFSPVTLSGVEAIDILRGGGQVRYGPQNVGGIINFRSRDIPDEFTVRVSGDLRFYSGGSNDLQANSGDIFVGGRFGTDDRFGLSLSYSTIQGETHRDGSDQDIHNFYGKFQFDINADHKVTLIGQYYEGEAELPGGLSVAQYNANPYQTVRPNDKGRVDRTLFAVQYEGNLSPSTKLEFQSYYYENFREFQFSTQNGGAFGQADGTRFDVLPREYSIFAVEARVAQAFTLGSADVEVGAGVRYLTEDSREQRFRRQGGGFDPFNPFATAAVLNRSTTIDTEALSYFIDATIDVGNLRIVPGVRIEDVDIEFFDELAATGRTINYFEVLPSIGVNYAVNDAVALFATYNESFGSIQQVQLSSAARFNPNLDPELAKIYEVGARFDNNAFQGSATAFYIDFDSVFFLNGGQWSNFGATRHVGLELEGSYRLPTMPITIYGNYTYTDATDEGFTATNGNRIEFVSEHVALLGAEYQGQNYSVFAEVYSQSDQFSDRANTVAESADGRFGRIPGFELVNVGGEWNVSDTVTVNGGIRNLFDKRHFTRSTDTLGRGKYVGEPRTFYLRGTVTF